MWQVAGMFILLLGLSMFSVVHLFSMLMPAARTYLKMQVGEGPFKGAYSLVAVAGVALIIWGYHIVANGPEAGDLVYEPAAGNRHITMLLVLLAFIGIGASHGKGYIKTWVRQPMAVGVALWSVGHLLSNGRRYDLYIFGTFLALAVLDFILCTARGKAPTHQPVLRSDIIAVVAGVILYAVFAWGFHPYVLGIAVMGG
jgi:uncharacterized membrane protein